MTESADRLVATVAQVTAAASNEQSLRHGIESALEKEARALTLPWVPYQLDRTLRSAEGVSFADAIHGAVVIEYEPPASFGGKEGSVLKHARVQAKDYARLLASEEGRPLDGYILVAWDGAHISFGTLRPDDATWEPLLPFTSTAAERLLGLLRDRGRPLVHPQLLRVVAGPESAVGASVLPKLFASIVNAAHPRKGEQSRTTLLFTEWKRLFGQAVGIETDRLQEFLRQQSEAHEVTYEKDIPAYLFALHTYIAIVAKLVAALALPRATQNVADASVALRQRLRALESGALFADAGISNMLTGDFFSWYIEDENWSEYAKPLSRLVAGLGSVSFDVTHKAPDSVRDLFKGIYEVFVPRELRHALGEVYTPDWLAGHALDTIGWRPEHQLLDPTCGTGTFLLEAIRRRMVAAEQMGKSLSLSEVLVGLYGIDLNPLAILAAKSSLVVVLSAKLDPKQPVTLPVYLADAINSAEPEGAYFVHTLQTEVGEQRFVVPEALVRRPDLHALFERLRDLVNAGVDADAIVASIRKALGPLSRDAMTRFIETVQVLVGLHREGWDGIWCPILADRFAAGAIPKVTHIAGNPPWVKWSHLPPKYSSFIKPLCLALNVFSDDRYVGGIESDISTVITFTAIRRWLAPGGHMGFFITATVYSNESSQGFRRFANNDGTSMAAVLDVQDFKAVAPFEGVTNHPSLLHLRQGGATDYPVPYVVWLAKEAGPLGTIRSKREFLSRCEPRALVALPVPGSDAGPWLKGTVDEIAVWRNLFDAAGPSAYRARKGITTDLNGVYFVRIEPAPSGSVWAQNDPTIGRTPGLARVRRLVETDHIFPLMRGRGLSAFRASLDPEFHVIVPQRTMHGDPTLPTSAPKTYRYLKLFEEKLRERGSYRRYQQTQPFWSTWSTGPYTFSPFKVLWKEMGGNRFCAAYVGPVSDAALGERVVVPDHKLYFVPVDTLEVAQYVTGILNAPTVAAAISGYASQLSLGTSIVENLRLPSFNHDDATHVAIATIAGAITRRGGEGTGKELKELDRLALRAILG